MIIKCIADKIENVCSDKTMDFLDGYYHRLEGRVDSIKKNQCYIVYSMFEPDGGGFKWYLINYETDKPIWVPEMFFEVIDHKMSKYWMPFWVDGIAGVYTKGKLHTFPEFTEKSESDFYIKLIEGSESHVKTFNDLADKIRDDAIL
jgi:hypothetical protein